MSDGCRWLVDNGYSASGGQLDTDIRKHDKLARVRQTWKQIQDAGTVAQLNEVLEQLLGREIPSVALSFLRRHMAAALPKTVRQTPYRTPWRWSEFLAVRVHDLPGRLMRLWLSNAAGEWGVIPHVKHDGRAAEIGRTGFVFLEAAMAASPASLVVFESVPDAIQLQIRAHEGSGKPVGCVGLVPGAYRSHLLPQLRRPITFHCHALTPTLVTEAANAGGMILVSAKVPRAISAAATLRKIQQDARPWAAVTADHLQSLPAESAVIFLTQTKLTATTFQPVLQRLRPDLQAVFRAHFEPPGSIKRGGVIYSRDPRGIVRDGRVVSTCMVNIAKVSTGSVRRYSGTIELPGRSFKFSDVPAAELEDNLANWLRFYLWRRGQSAPTILPNFRRSMFDVCFQLSQPELESPPPKVGWKSGAIQTRQYAIHTGGRIESRAARKTETLGNLATPEPLSPRLIAGVDQSVGMAVCLATQAYVAAALLQRLFGYETPPLWLCGDAAVMLGRAAAAAAGCGAGKVGKSRWPQLLSLAQAEEWLSEEDRPAIIYCSDWMTALSVGALHNHLVVEAHDRVEPDAFAREACRQILPAYLQDLARRQFECPPVPGPGWARVVHDFFAWWTVNGGAIYQDTILFAQPLARTAAQRFVGEALWRARGARILESADRQLHFELGVLADVARRAFVNPRWQDLMDVAGIPFSTDGARCSIGDAVMPESYPAAGVRRRRA